ncbi:pteridine reductase [Paraglaciecola aquimarina]|uniref:Pteridine reductase n=1 Tax=Paraglaciecola aquimarina TaxID=1235557 RepID=A0ABU3SZD7_9ALTE|nr:pteridine reductase [Paraglaciecola aquimarina]MDU0355372.1 pteridine reductase [Paraglaciecola aquimarina]
MNNKVAFITGSAKRIGAHTAKHLHGLGINVVVHCNQSRIEAEQLCQDLNAIRAKSARLVQGDLSTLSHIDRVGQQAIDSFGRLDILINNASTFYPTPIGTITPQDWHSLVGSNMQGPLFLSQFCHTELAKNNGAIINMVDIHAAKPLKQHTVYCMAKSALVTMTQSLALELAPSVRVNGIAPGAILWPEQPLNDEDKEEILKHIPAQRLGSMEDIAHAIEYLIAATYVSGQILAIDGGRSISSHTKG